MINRFSSLLVALLLGSGSAIAEQKEPNPYLDRPAAELRRHIADASPALDERWYQVDLVIFARSTPPGGEYWRLDRYPDFPRNPIHLAGKAGDASRESDADSDQIGYADNDEARLPEEADRVDRHASAYGAWQPLEPAQSHLDQAARALERNAGYRILYRNSWHQPIREQQRAFPVYLQGGRELPLPVPELIPFATFDNDAPGHDEGRVAPASTLLTDGEEIEVPLSVALTEPELRGTLRLSLARFLHVEPNLWFSGENDEGERYHVPITQSRRMRSEETHYIDHPLFGLIIRITPWEHPEQTRIKQMKEALEAR